MPGLLSWMAKTAVVSDTAQVIRDIKNQPSTEKSARAYSEAQQQVHGQQVVYTQPQSAAPAPEVLSQEDTNTQLERLGTLKDQGILTEEEFQAQRAKILGL